MTPVILNQTDNTAFAYMVPGPNGPRPCPSDLLQQNLSGSRPLSGQMVSSEVSLQSYFEGIKHFLTVNSECFRNAIAASQGQKPSIIQTILLVAEKSGSDYHPARIVVESGSEKHYFAVNVAITSRGLLRIDSEFDSMRFLGRHFRKKFVPKVYFSGAISLPGPGPEVKMFLTEWFNGYNEFHLFQDPASGEIHATLWETPHRTSLLTDSELHFIYQQAAYVLTYYYDVASYSEIYPWHHAAGDFVVSRSDGGINVKLIAARQYASRLSVTHSIAPPNLEAAALFLANLTIRMRLDRNQGIGDILWGPSHCVGDTILGFLGGLSAQTEEGRVSESLSRQIVEYLRIVGPERLAEIFLCVIDAYDSDAPDLKTIHDNIGEHVFEVFRALRSILV